MKHKDPLTPELDLRAELGLPASPVDRVTVLCSVDMLLAKIASGQTLPSRVVPVELLEGFTCASGTEAQVRLEGQRRWYNEEHLHSSLKCVPPAAFARAWRQEQAETRRPC